MTTYSTWDAMLLDMVQQPADVVVVSARRRGRGHGGWSKDNPYLEDRFVEFNIDIEPPALVSRILSVRQQIATEWITDLDTLRILNSQILASYHDKQTRQRDNEQQQQQQQQQSQQQDATARHTDSIPASSSSPPPSSLSTSSTAASSFDRNAGYFLWNSMLEQSMNDGDAQPSSYLRQGNFDLLMLLATQEAIHRVLRAYQQAGEERAVSYAWFQAFYTRRLRTYFDGDGEWHRADTFLDELLTRPPSTVELPRQSTATQAQIALVDPLRIATDVLEARADVVDDWQTIMKQDIPLDHMELQRSILAVRMGKSISPASSSASETINEPSSSSSFGDGAFE